jgi:hypothetical protein
MSRLIAVVNRIANYYSLELYSIYGYNKSKP